MVTPNSRTLAGSTQLDAGAFLRQAPASTQSGEPASSWQTACETFRPRDVGGPRSQGFGAEASHGAV